MTEPEHRTGQRGPVDHERREQIIQAADQHFRRYGYGKTSVADLAREIGVSSAYIYRFFESKRAIGEAVCVMTTGRIDAQLHAIAGSTSLAASERLRRLLRCMLDSGVDLLFHERKLHDIVVHAITENWSSVEGHIESMTAAIREVVIAGRESGEFERKTPLDEVCGGILAAAISFAHPMVLQLCDAAELDRKLTDVTSLVLRSLAP